MSIPYWEGETIQAATCPSCKRELVWSDINQQWYCQKCELFYQPGANTPKSAFDHLAEEVKDIFSPKPTHQIYYCSSCNTPLNWVQQYNRWYCYTCRRYV